MNDNFPKTKYFRANELCNDTVLITTKLPYLSECNVVFLIDALDLMTDLYNKLIIDVSEIQNIDNLSLSILLKKINKFESTGGSIKLVVSEDKPIISSIRGNNISAIDVHLSLDTALNDIIN